MTIVGSIPLFMAASCFIYFFATAIGISSSTVAAMPQLGLLFHPWSPPYEHPCRRQRHSRRMPAFLQTLMGFPRRRIS